MCTEHDIMENRRAACRRFQSLRPSGGVPPLSIASPVGGTDGGQVF